MDFTAYNRVPLIAQSRRVTVSADWLRATMDHRAILDLPEELLGEISVCYVDQYIAAWAGTTSPFYGWLVISHICHAWRETVLRTPQVWANILFQQSPHSAACVKAMLERSGQVPLSMMRRFSSSDVEETDEALGTLRAIYQELRRLKTLELKLTEPTMSRTFSDLRDTAADNGPFLESLAIKVVLDRGVEGPSNIPIFSDTNATFPRLRYLSIHRGSVTLLKSLTQGRPQITHLDITIDPLPFDADESLLHALAQLPNLQIAKIGRLSRTAASLGEAEAANASGQLSRLTPVLPPPIALANLRELHLPTGDAHSEICWLLRRLNLPYFTRLFLSMRTADARDLQYLLKVLKATRWDCFPGYPPYTLLHASFRLTNLVIRFAMDHPVGKYDTSSLAPTTNHAHRGDVTLSMRLTALRPITIFLATLDARVPIGDVKTATIAFPGVGQRSWARIFEEMPKLRELNIEGVVPHHFFLKALETGSQDASTVADSSGAPHRVPIPGLQTLRFVRANLCRHACLKDLPVFITLEEDIFMTLGASYTTMSREKWEEQKKIMARALADGENNVFSVMLTRVLKRRKELMHGLPLQYLTFRHPDQMEEGDLDAVREAGVADKVTVIPAKAEDTHNCGICWAVHARDFEAFRYPLILTDRAGSHSLGETGD